MARNTILRRNFIGSLAAASLASWHPLLFADNHLLPATPADAEGPFYPIEIPTDSDNDLLRVMGRESVSPGQMAYVKGKVMDRAGTVIDGARVEIWQCDNGGVYHHPGDTGSKDQDFQGFGAMVTNREGEYHFRTLRPVPYTGRTPHIHYRVTAPGFQRLTTQLYVNEESNRNAEDFLYLAHSEPERALITASFKALNVSGQGPVIAEFNIVLG